MIAIGDGKRVKVSESTFQHIFQHHINQTRKAAETLAAAEITNQVLESEIGQLLYKHHKWTFTEGMRHLGHWE